MSEVLVGTAYWLAQLRYEQFTQGVSAVEQQIARLKALTSKPLLLNVGASGSGSGAGGGGASSPDAQAAAYTRLQRSQAALELQQARIARGQGDVARAAALEAQAQARLTSELQAQTRVTTQSIAIERQLATAQQQSARAAQQAAQQQAQVAALKAQQTAQIIARAEQQGAQSRVALPVIGRSNDFGTQALDSFKSGLLGIAGPAAAATAAIGALTATAQSFKEAFVFKAALDATTASVKSQLDGFRNVSQTYAEATAFGRQYNITQEQTNSILQSSVGSLRTSSAGVAQLETALIRLQSKDVSKPLSEAARALAELESGDVTSIKELFRVSAKDALGMRDAIVAGGDSVLVLTEYLDRTQTGMHALELRAQGVQGAFNAAEVAAEDLKLAQADLASGPGVIATQTYTGVLQLLTSALTQGSKAQKFFNDVRAEAPSGGGGTFEFQTGVTFANAYTTAASAAAQASQELAGRLNYSAQAMQISAQASATDTAAKDAQQNVTALVAFQSKQAVDGFLSLNPGIDASTAASLAAAQGYNPQIQQLIAMRLESDAAAGALGRLTLAQGIAAGAAGIVPENRHIGGTGNTIGGVASGIGGGAGTTFQRVDAQQQALQASRDALALSRATTSAQRIAIYERQLARQTTEEGRNRIQAQIEGERRGGAGRVSAAQSTALQLNQVEENSGLALLKTQRENLERLRDQAEDFDVRRTRAQEDFAEKRRALLARGQRSQAAELARDFAKEQRREQEDFDRQRRRTLRNNAEGVGDIGARADLRQDQISDRAALRGVRAMGGVDLGVARPTLTGTAPANTPTRQQAIAQLTIQGVVNLDGKAVGTGVWPTIAVLVDEDLSVSLAQIGVPGSGQSAVGGVG